MMKRWRRRCLRDVWPIANSLVLTAIAALGASAAEGQTTPVPPKACGTSFAVAKLMDTFYSCATVEDVRKAVASRKLQWKMRQGGPQLTQLSVAEVANFSHLGTMGELRFLFFRNRLAQVHFSPPDLQEYWRRLVRAEALQVTTTTGGNSRVTRALVGDRVEVWLTMDPDPRHRSVGWRDMPLDTEIGYEID
jgi:hypothetical protein